MVTLLIVAGAVCFWGFKSGDSRSFQIAKNLDIFNSIVKELDMFYVDTIDPNKTIREGIDAMLYSLDPYKEFLWWYRFCDYLESETETFHDI